MRVLLFLLGLAVLGAGAAFFVRGIRTVGESAQAMEPAAVGHSVSSRIAQFGGAVHARLDPVFSAAGVPYPPAHVTLVGLKEEKMLEVYARGSSGPIRFIHAYPILAASGIAGPKLAEGDRQVPEGFYAIEALNPNSLFHLSLRVNYPSPADHEQAKLDARTNLGDDIMIHGADVSTGCLAMGDEAAEDLFVLAALTGIENVTVILSPVDFRVRQLPPGARTDLPWMQDRYRELEAALRQLPARSTAPPRQ